MPIRERAGLHPAAQHAHRVRSEVDVRDMHEPQMEALRSHRDAVHLRLRCSLRLRRQMRRRKMRATGLQSLRSRLRPRRRPDPRSLQLQHVRLRRDRRARMHRDRLSSGVPGRDGPGRQLHHLRSHRSVPVDGNRLSPDLQHERRLYRWLLSAGHPRLLEGGMSLTLQRAFRSRTGPDGPVFIPRCSTMRRPAATPCSWALEPRLDTWRVQRTRGCRR